MGQHKSHQQKLAIAEAYAKFRPSYRTEDACYAFLADYFACSKTTIRDYKDYKEVEAYAETELTVGSAVFSNQIEDFGKHCGLVADLVEPVVKLQSISIKPEDIPPFVPETSSDYETRQPKILLFDIETAPNTAWVWGHWEQNVLGYVSQWYMLAFCAKWLDSGEVISKCLPDYKSYQPGTQDDAAMLADLWKLFDEADVIIGHNLDAFDIGKSNARFIVHGFRPPAPYKTIDTKKVARRYFKFNSNKLDELGNTLGVGRKIKHTGFDLWKDCMSGDLEAWEIMRSYNRMDVLLLEKVYNKLKPWMTNHPNMAILSEIENGCPVCASTNLEPSGFAYTATTKRNRYQCKDCGAWSIGKSKKVTDIR